MNLQLTDLFDPDDANQIGTIGSPDWNRAVFARAYSDLEQHTGQFDRVIAKLRSGFPVLVYLPGKCMQAAADLVKQEIQNKDWKECGNHPGKGNPIEAWDRGSDFVGDFLNWLKNHDSDEPHAIYHNLDLLCDGRGGLLTASHALAASFSLIEATRRGVVLGLADRDAGELPPQLQQAFTDHVWFKTIEGEAFRRLVPLRLGKLLSGQEDTVPEGPIQQIIARLQWSDPLRAVRIMDDVSKQLQQGRIARILEEIRKRTLPPDYRNPSQIFSDRSSDLSGFDDVMTIPQLKTQIVNPYVAWTNIKSNDAALWLRETRKLRQGVILYGPAGTGKTTLAKWIAQNVNLPIQILSAAEIRRPLYGDAERMVRKIFREARRAAPCVLVLDDADDLFPDRDKIGGSVATADLGIVNATLQELEGINGPLTGVLIVMTTNRFHFLDEAIKQRLSLYVKVPYPVNDHQIGEIVDAAADQYGLELTEEVRTALVEEFRKPVDIENKRGENLPCSTEEERRRCTHGLFAPRTIVRNMLLLIAEQDQAVAGGRYSPTMADVARLQKYHLSHFDEDLS